MDKVAELDTELTFMEKQIQEARQDLKTMEDDIAIIKKIKVSSENFINTMQKIYDRGSV